MIYRLSPRNNRTYDENFSILTYLHYLRYLHRLWHSVYFCSATVATKITEENQMLNATSKDLTTHFLRLLFSNLLHCIQQLKPHAVQHKSLQLLYLLDGPNKTYHFQKLWLYRLVDKNATLVYGAGADPIASE